MESWTFFSISTSTYIFQPIKTFENEVFYRCILEFLTFTKQEYLKINYYNNKQYSILDVKMSPLEREWSKSLLFDFEKWRQAFDPEFCEKF